MLHLPRSNRCHGLSHALRLEHIYPSQQRRLPEHQHRQARVLARFQWLATSTMTTKTHEAPLRYFHTSKRGLERFLLVIGDKLTTSFPSTYKRQVTKIKKLHRTIQPRHHCLPAPKRFYVDEKATVDPSSSAIISGDLQGLAEPEASYSSSQRRPLRFLHPLLSHHLLLCLFLAEALQPYLPSLPSPSHALPRCGVRPPAVALFMHGRKGKGVKIPESCPASYVIRIGSALEIWSQRSRHAHTT